MRKRCSSREGVLLLVVAEWQMVGYMLMLMMHISGGPLLH